MELDYNKINILSNTTKAFVFKESEFLNLINEFKIPKNIENVIENRIGFSENNRIILAEVFKEQYSKFDINTESLVYKNIEKLKNSNTFTVTSGQQLHVFGGPMMVHYKIIHSILLCQKYQNEFPNYNFVPVFWLASEDHDFNEVNKINILDKSYTWQTPQKGAVGRFNLTELRNLLNQIKSDFKDSNYNSIIIELAEFYFKFNDYATSTQALFNHLYEKYGLLVLNPDNKKLKTQIKELIISDIIDNINYQPFENLTSKFKENNFKIQLKSKPINFFKISIDRIPILKENNDNFIIGEESITKNELINDINENIENYSPNAVLRPLFQEIVLPNIAYIGGNAEVNYWLQCLPVFKLNKVKFPFLILRKSMILSSTRIEKALNKLNLNFESLFNLNSKIDFVKFQEKNNRLVKHFEDFILELEIQKGANINSEVILGLLQNKYTYYKEIRQLLKSISETDYEKILKLKKEGFDLKNFQERNFLILNFTQNIESLLRILINKLEINSHNVQVLNI